MMQLTKIIVELYRNFKITLVNPDKEMDMLPTDEEIQNV